MHGSTGTVPDEVVQLAYEERRRQAIQRTGVSLVIENWRIGM
jgi:hypothetical protein